MREFLRVQFDLRVSAGSNAVGAVVIRGSNEPTIADGLWTDPTYAANQADQTDVTSLFTLTGSALAAPRLNARLVGYGSLLPNYVRVDYTHTSGSRGALTVDIAVVQRGADDALGVSDATPPAAAGVVSHLKLDVRRFVPNGMLTDDNIRDAIEDARLAAYALTSEAAGWCYDVYVPAGRYALDFSDVDLLSFPGTGVNTPTPGLVGDGEFATVFVTSGLANSEFALTLGGVGVGDVPGDYTYRQRVKGFGLQNAGGSGLGNGILITQSYDMHLADVRVYGYQTTATTPDYGVGIRTQYGRLSQHPVLDRVTVQNCQRGFDLNMIAQGRFNQVSTFQNTWLGATIENCSICWTGGNLQSNTDPNPDQPFAMLAGRAHNVVTGFGYTTGLDSGTGATLSTTSGGLCTLTGLTGLHREEDRGRWIKLTDPSPLSPNKVDGYYKIVAVLSASSCTIEKASNHTSRTVTWAIHGQVGSNFISITGTYDEGSKRSTFGFWRDEVGASIYDIRNLTAANTAYAVDADGVSGTVSVFGVGQSSGLRVRSTSSVDTDYAFSVIAFDDYTYRGLKCRHNNVLGQQGAARDSGGGRSVRLRSLVRELGAAEAWDARLASSFTLATLAINAWTGYLNSTVLAPGDTGHKPQYVASDTGFDGPGVQITGGTTPGWMTGAISSAVLPAFNYTGTIVSVVRLGSASAHPADGTRRIEAVNAGLSVANMLFDGLYTANPWYTLVQDGAGAAVASATNVADIEPHILVSGTSINRTNLGVGLGTDFAGTEWTHGANSLNQAPTYTLATNIDVNIAPQYGTNTAEFFVAFLAFFPRALTEAEYRQIIDCARNEWPLVA